MLKGSSSQLMDSGRVGVGKDLVFFKDLDTRSLTMLQWATQNGLGIFFSLVLVFFSLFSFLGGWRRSLGLGSDCD